MADIGEYKQEYRSEARDNFIFVCVCVCVVTKAVQLIHLKLNAVKIKRKWTISRNPYVNERTSILRMQSKMAY